MTDDRTSSDKFSELRRQAEDLLNARPDPAPEPSSTALDLINELQIHQVELEIQNEELKQAQGELSALYREYEALYEFAPCGYVTVNEEGIITRVNLTAVELLKTDRKRLLGGKFSRRISHEKEDVFLDALNQAGLTGEKQTVELRLNRVDAAARWVRLDIEADRDETGWTKQWRMAMTDITERMQADEQLKRSEERYRRIVETAEEGIWLVDREWETEFVNARMAEMLGYPPDEMIGRHLLSFMDEQEQSRARELMARREQGVNEKHDFKFQRRDGADLWAIVSTNAVISEDGQFMHAMGMVTDITERKRAEEALRNKRKMLARTERIAHIGSWEWDIATDTVTWSEELFRIFKMTPGEKGPNWNEHQKLYHPEDMARLREAVGKAVSVGKPYEIELRALRKDGKTRFCLAKGFPETGNDGRPCRIFGFLQDITDRKRAEVALQKSLAEKEVLLREIHHRVKNNMQAIIGLLRMHARRTNDAHLTEIFTDCRDRIGAMSLIHEALYQSDNLARIDFEAYLKKLCRNLAQAHDAPRRGITLTSSAAAVSMNMDRGVAVGMIIAELVSNAFKYAFPSGGGGTVTVGMTRTDSETAELTVADDGKGLPEDFDISTSTSLGMRLVSGAVLRELGGSIEAANDGGAKFVIRFHCGEEPNESR